MMDGVLNVRKEKGFTSHDVVAKLRGILHMKKIGHTGTLDPEAEGVLPVVLGKATRLVDMLTEKEKTYEALLHLGIETDTQDMTGTVLKELPVTVTEEDVKKDFEIRMPDVGEYDKDTLLSYEKEVLGIYLSGHPLERYSSMMEKMISAKTTDFQADEEGGIPRITDGQKVIVGGMIADKTIKYTKTNKVMAFFTLEDLVGTVEVVVFPRDYEKWQKYLNEDARVFVQGHVDAGDDRASKLILEKVRSFDEMPKEVWIQFKDRDDYGKNEEELLRNLRSVPGNSSVVIYLKDVNAMKRLPAGYHVQITDSWTEEMKEKYGSSNVKVVERVLKNF